MSKSALILDDHPMIASSLKEILAHSGLFDLITTSHSLLDFQSIGQRYQFHCYLIDISLGDTDGRTIIKDIKKQNTSASIIAVSSHDHPRVIQSAFKAGADSYLIKTSPIATILSCVNALMSGNEYIPIDIQQILTNHLKGKPFVANPNFPELTARELEILQLITEENTSKEIAEKLFISEHTVESHRASLFAKFDVKNIAGLVRKAIIGGLVD
jgi:DNA-binding NarL/FixJ family response regulator